MGDLLNDFLSQAHDKQGLLKNNSVTTESLAPGSITGAKLATGSVTNANISDGTISEAKLASDVQTKLNRVGTGVTTVNGRTGDVVLTKSDVGLSNVDNTSDATKPVSTAVQAALNAKANTASLSTVATSGSYTDLSNRPSIPAQFSPIAGSNVTLSGTYPNITIASSSVASVTDLAVVPTATNLTVTSSTGADAVLASASTTNAGVLSSADKTKLDGVATGATANASDALLRDRSTHTGAQAISTVTGLQTALDAKATTASLSTVATSGAYADLTGKPTIPAQFSPVAGTNVTLTGSYPNVTISATPGAGVTDLTVANSANDVTIVSSTGNDALIAAATTIAAGVLSSADKTKLDGVATGATANATDTHLLNRANHTGAQAIATVTGLQTALDAKVATASLSTVATSGSYTDLSSKPTIPAQFTPVAGTNVTLSGTYPNITFNATPGAGVTDLSTTVTATNVTIASSTGADAVVPGATATDAGVMSSADKVKLNGIATGATANATDAQLRDRSTHTGAQAISTVTGLQTALDAKATTTHTHAATDIASGVIGTARLGTGTADSTTYLRGDGTWATVTGGGGSGRLGEVEVASFAGATYSDKFRTALATVGAETYKRALIMTPGATIDAGSTPFVIPAGVAIVGSAAIHTEFGHNCPINVRCTGGTAVFDLSANGSNYNTTKGWSIRNITFVGTGAQKLFADQPLDASGKLWAYSSMSNVCCDQLAGIYTGPMLGVTITGTTYYNNMAGTAFYIGGSDNTLWSDGGFFEMGSMVSYSTRATLASMIRFGNMSKTYVGPMYITGSPTTPFRLDGGSGGVELNGLTIEGRPAPGSGPNYLWCAGELIRLTGGYSIMRNKWYGYAMKDVASTGRTTGGYIHISGGEHLIDGGCVALYADQTASPPPFIRITAGKVIVRNMVRAVNSTALPVVSTVNASYVDADSTVTVVVVP